MRLPDLEALGRAAYTTKLRPPGEIRGLGEHVQVYAVRVYAKNPRARNIRALEILGVALHSEEHQVYIPGAAFAGPPKGRKVRHGVPLEEFARVVYEHLPKCSKKTRRILVHLDSAGNFGALDIHTLDSRLTFTPCGAEAFALKYLDKRAGHNLQFLDLSSFFPGQTAAEIARAVGVATGDVSQPQGVAQDIPALCKSFAVSQAAETWEILGRVRGGMLELFGVDPLVYSTPARAGAAVFTSSYLKEALPPVRKQIRKQALRSFWGGRMEAFARGTYSEQVSIYDAVSLYAHSAIRLGVMPGGEDWFRLSARGLVTCTGGFATVRFQFPATEEYPCLPVDCGGRIFYPLTGESSCTVHEIRYALECGAEIELLHGWGYDTGSTALADYSRDMLARKQAAEDAGDTVSRTLYKLLLNSLYGKFAQKRVGFDLETLREVCRLCNIPDIPTLDRITNWEEMLADYPEAQQLLERKRVYIGSHWCPEWTCLVNGYARYIESRAMRERLALAGTTDSVILWGDAGERFEIEGIPFVRQASGNHISIVRSRLYAITTGRGQVVQASGSGDALEVDSHQGGHGELLKAALHGAPDVAGMPEMLAAWDGGEWLTIEVPRVRKIKDGLGLGMAVGETVITRQHTSMHWDDKRRLEGGLSAPWAFVETRADPDTGEIICYRSP